MASVSIAPRLVAVMALVVTGAASCATVQSSPVTRSPGADRSFLLPAVEVIAMNGLLHLAGRQVIDDGTFAVTAQSIRRNLRGPWVVDDDPFQINQLLHPYQGAMYHDIARSSGLNYWQGLAYTFAGSALWEIASEATPPSRNDQITTSTAGPFLGEPLFRVSRLLLDRRNGPPGGWRTLAATVISPPAGINHMLFGDRFDPAARDVVPAVDIRAHVGVGATLTSHRPRVSASNRQLVGFSVEYGLPGKAGYAHVQPFDYFLIDGTASTANGFESVSSRGLVVGRNYQAGAAAHGVWGLYGTYDYLDPDVFRLSSTALSFGTTAQSWLSTSMTLHSTALLGFGYASTQSAHGPADRGRRYGVAPQALLGLRLIAGSRASLDLTLREYFVSDLAPVSTVQHDRIFRGDTALTLRLVGHHAFGVKYSLSRRRTSHPDVPRLTQARGTLGVFYAYLGSRGFGAVR
jgi:Domain of unknown function (DUF3943)